MPRSASALPQYADDFLRDLGQSPRTQTSYRTALVNLQSFAEATGLTPKPAPLPADRWQIETLADYFSWLKKKNYRNASVRLYLTAVAQYTLWLEAGQKLPAGLRTAELRAVLSNKIGRSGRRIRPDRRGSDPAVGLLLAHYREALAGLTAESPGFERKRLILLRNHALLHTLYATAGRASEIVQLQRADVAEGHATHVEIVGKGNKKRSLILTAPAQAAIQAYLRARNDSAPGLFVSHGRRKEQPLTTQMLWKIVNDAAKAVFGADGRGRPRKRVGPHTFRHLRAQDLSDEGMPITSLQAMLGHASIETTRGTYAPKTPVNQLVDEIATYGRDPQAVIERGRKSAEK